MKLCNCGNKVSNRANVCSCCRYPRGIRKCVKCGIFGLCDAGQTSCKICALERKMEKYKKEERFCSICHETNQHSRGNTCCNKCTNTYRKRSK